MTDDEFKALYDEALDFKKAEKYAEAKQRLTRLAFERPDHAPVRGVLAGVLFELNDFAAAVSEFRECSRLSPRSELASLGLFHSLLRTGDRAAAVEEMKRFTRLRPSAEYASLRAEFRREVGDED